MRIQTITIHPAAPDKPALGQACNGCGVCCLAEPCPVGIVVTRRRTGPCNALVWADAESRYRCGVVSRPEQFLSRVPRALHPLLTRLARRFIAAGTGCDSDATLE